MPLYKLEINYIAYVDVPEGENPEDHVRDIVSTEDFPEVWVTEVEEGTKPEGEWEKGCLVYGSEKNLEDVWPGGL